MCNIPSASLAKLLDQTRIAGNLLSEVRQKIKEMAKTISDLDAPLRLRKKLRVTCPLLGHDERRNKCLLVIHCRHPNAEVSDGGGPETVESPNERWPPPF